MTEIVTESHIEFNEEDFSAYNLELIEETNGDVTIAWTNQNTNTFDKVYIVNSSIKTKYDLNEGRIGGIEFSSLDQNIHYVSCSNLGIIKLDYTDGTY